MRRLLLVVIVYIAILTPSGVYAAGVTVSPAFQNIVVTQAMSGKDFIVTLTNQSTIGLNFDLSTSDFGTLDETGGVVFLGTPAAELEHRYGLVSWLTLDRNTVFIPQAGSKQIQVHVDNRPSLAPGGHYAALLATATGDGGASLRDPKVNLHQVIASLILVRKDGGAQPGLDLVGFSPQSKNWFHLPNYVDLRFHDAGNVHVIPHGTLILSDPSGKVVSRGIINEDSVTVFPESFRKMTSKLLLVRRPWLPGLYSLTATYRYDNDASTASQVTTFWYLGNALTAGLIILILLTSGVILWLLRKLHRI